MAKKNAPKSELRLVQWEDGDLGLVHVNVKGLETYVNARCIRVPPEMMIEFLKAVKNGDYDEQIGD